ncbi:SMI1/KNR4 family protein [Flavobacterium rhizosphaerae]|uniref:SMI1/KNR4 family protein n=1 Tax=Flavobacterium rhizosphaerae TaxID=3163298 RepID=A0ABW8YVA9_9FLAO
MNRDVILNLLYKFKKQGEKVSDDGATMIGRAPHQGPKGWLNILYPPLSKEELKLLEAELKTEIPKEYSDFLLHFSNGMDVLSSTLSLYGLRRHINRSPDVDMCQPYSIITPNIYERPDNSKPNYFFIGGYNWDGSLVYIDKETNSIHCCERWDATSKKTWNSLEEMILSELERLYTFFDDEGVEIDEDNPTIPYKT